jgi:hypothetical protein
VKIVSWFNTLSHTGVHEHLTAELQAKIVLANRISLVMIIVAVLSAPMLPSLIFMVPTVSVFILTIYFNYIHWYQLARFFLSSMIILNFVITYITGTNTVIITAPVLDGALKAIFISLVAIPMVLFEHNERRLLFISIIVHLILFYSVDYMDAQIALVDNSHILNPERVAGDTPGLYFLSVIIIFVCFWYFQQRQRMQQEKIEKMLAETQEKNRQLITQEKIIREHNAKLEMMQSELLEQQQALMIAKNQAEALLIESRAYADQLFKRQQLDAAVSNFQQLLYATDTQTPQEMGVLALRFLVNQANALQAVLYQAKQHPEKEIILKLVAAYAADKQHLKPLISAGEGIIGQTALLDSPQFFDGKVIRLSGSSGNWQIPISVSGCWPLRRGQQLIGVIEIAGTETTSTEKLAALTPLLNVLTDWLQRYAATAATEVHYNS